MGLMNMTGTSSTSQQALANFVQSRSLGSIDPNYDPTAPCCAAHESGLADVLCPAVPLVRRRTNGAAGYFRHDAESRNRCHAAAQRSDEYHQAAVPFPFASGV